MDLLKMYSLFKMGIFHCHVSSLEGKSFFCMNDAGSLLHDSLPTKYPQKWWGNVNSTLHESIYLCTHRGEKTIGHVGTMRLAALNIPESAHVTWPIFLMMWLFQFNLNIRYLMLLSRVSIIQFQRSLRKLANSNRNYTFILVIRLIFFKN